MPMSDVRALATNAQSGPKTSADEIAKRNNEMSEVLHYPSAATPCYTSAYRPVSMRLKWDVSLLMRAVVCLLAVLLLAAATTAVAQTMHLIDPMLPGSLDPKPLPPLKNPDAPSTPAKELFARKSTPFPGPPRSIGGDFDGCLSGAVSLPVTGPAWQVMRPS